MKCRFFELSTDLRCPRFLPLWRRNAKTRVNLEESETPEASSPSDIQSEKAVEEQRLLQSPEFVAVPLSRVEAHLSPVLPPTGKLTCMDPEGGYRGSGPLPPPH